MSRRRNPDLVSQYTCYFCGEQVNWGSLLRIMRTDPGQPDYELREIYGHHACVRAVVVPRVPLQFARHWHYKDPVPDDTHEIDGHPCGICDASVTADALTRLRIQKLAGTVKAPEFDEESVPVHRLCLDLQASWRRNPPNVGDAV